MTEREAIACVREANELAKDLQRALGGKGRVGQAMDIVLDLAEESARHRERLARIASCKSITLQ